MLVHSIVSLIPINVKLNNGHSFVAFVDLINNEVKSDHQEITEDLKQEILDRFNKNSIQNNQVLKTLGDVQGKFNDYHKEYNNIQKQYVKRALPDGKSN